MNSVPDTIADLIHASLRNLDINGSIPVTVERTVNSTFGDYTTNVALQLFPMAKNSQWSSPRELAQVIADRCAADSDQLTISVAGPGFINFTVASSVFTQIITNFSQKNFEWEMSGTGKTVIVEYSSPNIAKPFTVGHLRSTIIGDAIANLLQTVGFDVKRDNHVGDWGTQFGKLIVAIQKWGSLPFIEASQNPVKDLVALYIKFHEEATKDSTLEEEARQWFAKLEHGDKEAKNLWQQCVDWSWKEFEQIYKELGVVFTENAGRGYGESFFEEKMEAIIEELEQSGYLQTGKEGARLFFFPNDILPPLMILKKDGSTLYATRDLATDKYRLEHHHPSLIINEVGSEQELYFKQIYKIEELLGWYQAGDRVHVKHGHFRFKDGKMSTRKGNVIWLQDVIREAKKRALLLSKDETLAVDKIAIGALKWNDLKRSAPLDITFDWDEILAMEGNSGPYLQYTAVRCKSVLQKANSSLQSSIFPAKAGSRNQRDNLQLNTEERAVARQLLYFSETLTRAAKECAPHYLCTYLFELAQSFNSFYNKHTILSAPEDIKGLRLALTQATLEVLTHSLAILGIQVPTRM